MMGQWLVSGRCLTFSSSAHSFTTLPEMLSGPAAMLGHAPYETKDGVLGYPLLDLDLGLVELQDSLRWNLWVIHWTKR